MPDGRGHDEESERLRFMADGGGFARLVNCSRNENGSVAESKTLEHCTGSMCLIYCLKACQRERRDRTKVEDGR